MNRSERLNDNLTDAYKLLEQFIQHRKNLKGYFGRIAIFLDDNQLSEIISMITDYIGYISLDLQSEMEKRYCDHDQDALMDLYEGGDQND